MSNLNELKKTVAILRSPEGCPWDREQTHQSLAQHLIDECSELLETIDRDDKEHMLEELGDVLLQVVLHAQIASENGDFTLEDVAGEINAKLVRRHPHVFGDDATRRRLNTSDKVLVEWDKIKAREKAVKGKEETDGLFKPLPPRLPALLFATHVFKQIEKKSIPADAHIDCESIDARSEGLDEGSLGEALFHLAASARRARLDPESALRRYSENLMDILNREGEREGTADANG